MSIKQISVFLENKPGKLSDMTSLLAENNIDIRALSLAETKDFGIARMIVDDIFEAAAVLRDGDFIANFSPVLPCPTSRAVSTSFSALSTRRR